MIYTNQRNGENPPDQENRTRFTELDSLRGLAAVTVVLHHAFDMWPELRPESVLGRVFLGAVSGGEQAVVIFFILSGFVLTLPSLRSNSQSYLLFLIRRVLRIYGPYIVALALAVIGAAIWQQHSFPHNWITQTWYRSPTKSAIADHVLFIGSYDSAEFNTAFWSLVQEMRISIIFPLLAAFVVRWPRISLTTVTPILFLLTPVLALRSNVPLGVAITTSVCAMFIVGIELALNAPAYIIWLRTKTRDVKVILLVFGFILYRGGGVSFFSTGLHEAVQLVVATLGGSLILLMTLSSVTLGRMLNGKIPRFFGKISYSLYLVHGTVLWGIALSLHNQVSLQAQAGLYMILSFLMAWGFNVSVEMPCIFLSRRLSGAKS